VAREACIYGGGGINPPEDGATDIRVIGNTCTLTVVDMNTFGGMMSAQGDRWKILGNTFLDPPNRIFYNNNHAVYVQSGADDVEIAYNTFTNLTMGHVIQVHQDGQDPNIPQYDNIWIHDNLLTGTDPLRMRGINVGNVGVGSTVKIQNNILSNLGADFSAIAVYRGNVEVTGNQLSGIVASAMLLVAGQDGGTRHVNAHDNVFSVVAPTPYFFLDTANGVTAADLTLDNNSYCGNGSPPAADVHGKSC
jgi:hypothetical protein